MTAARTYAVRSRRVRADFEAATYLRTFAVRWSDREHLFDAELPWRDADEVRLAAWLEKTELVVTERRKSRMSIGFAPTIREGATS